MGEPSYQIFASSEAVPLTDRRALTGGFFLARHYTRCHDTPGHAYRSFWSLTFTLHIIPEQFVFVPRKREPISRDRNLNQRVNSAAHYCHSDIREFGYLPASINQESSIGFSVFACRVEELRTSRGRQQFAFAIDGPVPEFGIYRVARVRRPAMTREINSRVNG